MPFAQKRNAMLRQLMPPDQHKYCQCGFTLLELMIVVAIIGITSTLAIPNLIAWQARYQLRQAVTEIASDLNLAKLVAMNRNRTATVTIQMAGSLIQLSGTAGGLEIFRTATLMPRVNTLPGGTATVNFSSLGLSTSTAAQTIQIGNNVGQVYSVSVAPSGKVNWCANPSCP